MIRRESKMEKIVLSQPKEFQIGNTVLRVVPLSLEKIIKLAPKIEQAEKIKGMEKQAEAFLDIVYEIVKDYNDIKREELKKILTLEATFRIVQEAIGASRLEAIGKNDLVM